MRVTGYLNECDVQEEAKLLARDYGIWKQESSQRVVKPFPFRWRLEEHAKVIIKKHRLVYVENIGLVMSLIAREMHRMSRKSNRGQLKFKFK